MAQYIPKIGKLSKPPETIQFSASGFDQLSFCTTPIEIIGDGCTVSACPATGFYWRKNDQTYLVTNWHVITGRDPFTQTRNKNGLIPRWLEFFGVNWHEADDKPGYLAENQSTKMTEQGGRPHRDAHFIIVAVATLIPIILVRIGIELLFGVSDALFNPKVKSDGTIALLYRDPMLAGIGASGDRMHLRLRWKRRICLDELCIEGDVAVTGVASWTEL